MRESKDHEKKSLSCHHQYPTCHSSQRLWKRRHKQQQQQQSRRQHRTQPSSSTHRQYRVLFDLRGGCQATAIGILGFGNVRGLSYDSRTILLYGTDTSTDQLIVINRGTQVLATVKARGRSPVSQVVQQEENSQILDALSVLEEVEREVILLRFFQDEDCKISLLTWDAVSQEYERILKLGTELSWTRVKRSSPSNGRSPWPERVYRPVEAFYAHITATLAGQKGFTLGVVLKAVHSETGDSRNRAAPRIDRLYFQTNRASFLCHLDFLRTECLCSRRLRD
jgi:hypothetical protein